MEPSWTITISLRILVDDGKRTLQQRYTRLSQKDGKQIIEERWDPVPVVSVEDISTGKVLTKLPTTIK